MGYTGKWMSAIAVWVVVLFSASTFMWAPDWLENGTHFLLWIWAWVILVGGAGLVCSDDDEKYLIGLAKEARRGRSPTRKVTHGIVYLIAIVLLAGRGDEILPGFFALGNVLTYAGSHNMEKLLKEAEQKTAKAKLDD